MRAGDEHIVDGGAGGDVFANPYHVVIEDADEIQRNERNTTLAVIEYNNPCPQIIMDAQHGAVRDASRQRYGFRRRDGQLGNAHAEVFR